MPDQGGGLLARSGLDSIKIAGHKVPIALLAGLVALVGVLVVLRARQTGGAVSAGSPPAAGPILPDFGGTGLGPDVGGVLAGLQDQVASLSGAINAKSAAPAPSSLVTLQGRPGYLQNALGQALLAVWPTPGTSGGALTQLAAGTQLASAGVPVAGQLYGGSGFWQPVKLPTGATGYVWAADTVVSNPGGIQ